ncbi:MAG: 50S ribosomal protein L11 methyltransferase [Desulfobacterales bacterium]|jgi:ribosomal protein L11 methyltransferase
MHFNPYGMLHIYYLSGRLDHKTGDFGGGYLGNWEEEDTSFLFFSRPAAERIEKLLADQPHLGLLDTYQMTYEQWQGGCLEPLTIGGITLVPPWFPASDAPADPGGIVLTLDPGLVFGSGTHPTTADCLRALQSVFSRGTPPETVLDLGTGTGVLALAAAKLGSRRVLAVDLNPLAAHTARRNVVANGLGSRVLAIQGRAEGFVDRKADLLLANIHFEVLDKVMAAPGFVQKPRVILSGLLRSEARAAKTELIRRGFRIQNTWENNGTWFTILAASANKTVPLSTGDGRWKS